MNNFTLACCIFALLTLIGWLLKFVNRRKELNMVISVVPVTSGWELEACAKIEAVSCDSLECWTFQEMGVYLDELDDVTFLVAKIADSPVGYLAYEQVHGRLVLLKLAVWPVWRRHGIASRLLWNIQSRGLPLLCDVHERNVEAQLFLRAGGLHCYGTSGDVLRFGWGQMPEKAMDDRSDFEIEVAAVLAKKRKEKA